MEYIIYADESEERGTYFAHFYGGALVRSADLPAVLERLKAAKAALRFGGKIKWQKVTAQYLFKYMELMDVFFDLVESDVVKIRVMFLHRTNVPVGLTEDQKKNSYYLLYYQFLKNAFGLQHSTHGAEPASVRFYLDRRSATHEQKAQFKAYIASLEQQPQFRNARILFPAEQIAEVAISDHDLLQCLDVVVGAMQFRLNDFHLKKPEGAKRRAARTVAKEKLYKMILRRIRRIHPNFNIGISTGTDGDPANHWRHPYRHWEFMPKESRYDPGRVKPKKRKAP